MPYWIAGAALLGDVAGSVFGSNSAEKANRTNIKLAREQRGWEESMANSAVQRRRKDVEAAGFNPLLAVTGPGAATPSISAPTVEPTFRGEQTKGSVANALLLKEQLQNVRANTAAQQAEARIKNVEASIREELSGQERDTRANKFVEQREWDDLRTEILRSQSSSSAAEAKRHEGTVDAMIEMAKQQQKAGRIDLAAIENIAKMGGLEMGKMQGIMKLILDIVTPRTWDARKKD